MTDNKLAIEMAAERINQLCEDLEVSNNLGIKEGLTGIGWGIVHLVKEGFIEPESLDILSVLDEEIIRYDVKRIQDLSFETGFSGLLFYINCRLSYAFATNTFLPFDEMYYQDIDQFIKKLYKE